ncbi:hypothetical protein U1Q18_015339, partial [Sarracenia purpurea var. burkii]
GAGAQRRWRHNAEVSSGTASSIDGAVRRRHDDAGARRRWRSVCAAVSLRRWCPRAMGGDGSRP